MSIVEQGCAICDKKGSPLHPLRVSGLVQRSRPGLPELRLNAVQLELITSGVLSAIHSDLCDEFKAGASLEELRASAASALTSILSANNSKAKRSQPRKQAKEDYADDWGLKPYVTKARSKASKAKSSPKNPPVDDNAWMDEDQSKTGYEDDWF